MASCIHPSCSCKAYQEPKHEKGTLLQLRRGCQGCKHHASDHRQLSAVDRLIETEVAAAAENKCTQLIPVSEIPQSPMFGPHDLIPLPFDDTPNKESGVPCGCVGFQVASVVSLWQKFRTYSLNDAMSAIPQTACSLCRHPLLSHQTPENGSSLGLPPSSEKGVSGLVLKNAAKVDFVPVSGDCVQFIPPKDARGNLMFLALAALDPADSSLLLWVCSRALSLQEKKEEGGQRGREEGGERGREEGGQRGREEGRERGREEGEAREESEKMANKKYPTIAKSLTHSMKPLDSESVATSATGSVVDLTVGDEISGPVEDKKSKNLKSPKKRGRKRKQTAVVPVSPRKSARIAARKQASSTANEKLRLDVIFQLKDISLDQTKLQRSGSEDGMPTALDCQREAGDLALRENVTAFVDSLKKKENHTSYKLPEAISSTSFEVMAATTTTSCCPSPAAGKEALLVALGGVAGEVSVWAPASGLQSTPLEHSCRISGLCWQELSSEATSKATSGVFLCVGGSRGTLHIWHVQLQVAPQRIQCQSYPIERHVDVPTRADITACSWAPNGKFLAAGSLYGEVLVYTVPSCEHIQTVHCCRAPVTCFAWSADCSMLAVGGSDDCVQVLQRSSPPSTQTHPRNSILKYMKVDPKSRKYIHTHSFTGHQSFIGSLTFLSSDTGTNTLASIGWDSQILLWKIQSNPDFFTSSQSRGHGRNQPHLPVVDTEPYYGYKVGPSASVEFLPVALHAVPGCGLVAMLVDKFGAVTIANYHFDTLR